MRRSPRARLGVLLTTLLAACSVAATAAGAPTGYDVSHPQCGAALPAGAAFGIVGVNAGLANTANPCLGVELAWAAATPGLAGPRRAPASLYLNTADPGNGVPDWPTQAFGAAAGATPYGGCDGSWSAACGYLYGAVRAASSYQLVSVANAGVSPAGAPWWLDIETLSTWAKPADSPGWAALNIATIRGFVAGLRAAGARARIGFYSTKLQWLEITGLDAGSSPAQFPTSAPDWIAGVGSRSDAQARCGDSFSGGEVELAQFSSGGLDGDYACPPAIRARLRVVSRAVRGGALRVSGTISVAFRGRLRLELTAAYRGRAFHRRLRPAVAAGRWQAVVALPRPGRLSGAVLTVSSPAGNGLLAGRVLVRVRLQ